MRERGRRGETMGRLPCCDKGEVKKGAWTLEEDKILVDYITKNGHGTWRSFPKLAAYSYSLLTTMARAGVANPTCSVMFYPPERYWAMNVDESKTPQLNMAGSSSSRIGDLLGNFHPGHQKLIVGSLWTKRPILVGGCCTTRMTVLLESTGPQSAVVSAHYSCPGLRRCGKSCRLRWTNYLRPDIKRGAFSYSEEQKIFQLHALLGNKWASIASRLPGRTDNEIKNYWNSHLRKRIPDKDTTTLQASSASTSADIKPNLLSTAEHESASVEADARLSMDPILHSSPPGLPDCDFFLRAWNSEAGESFQKAHAIKVESDYVVGPAFNASSSGASVDEICKVEAEDATNSGSYSPNSYKTDKTSDITLDLLLDFPNDGEYLQYLQGDPDDNKAST